MTILLVSHGAAKSEGESFVLRRGKNPLVPLLFFFTIKMPRKSSQSGFTTLKGAWSSARASALADPRLDKSIAANLLGSRL